MSTLESCRIDPATQVNQAIDACAKQCAEQCKKAKRTLVARVVDFLVWLNEAIASDGPQFAVYEDRRKFDVEAQQRLFRASLYRR